MITPYVTGLRRHTWLTAVAAAVRLVTPQLATESGQRSMRRARAILARWTRLAQNPE